MNSSQYREITYQEFLTLRGSSNYVIIDIRSPYEYEKDHIPGAKSIPEYDLFKRLNELRKDKVYIFICQKGKNSKDVALTLADYGYRTINLKEGMNGIYWWIAPGWCRMASILSKGISTIDPIVLADSEVWKCLLKFMMWGVFFSWAFLRTRRKRSWS